MIDLRVRPKAPDAGGRVIDITPESAGWRYVGFEVRKLAAGQSASFSFPGREACVVVLTGSDRDRDIQTSLSLGARAYIVKPVDLRNLTRVTSQLRLQWALIKTPAALHA